MSALVERVLRELPGNVYALLDGGRDPRIRNFVIDTRAAAWCLYRGNPLPAAVEQAAPWLVRITPGMPWVEQLFARGWQQSWGVFLSTDAPSRELRRHLRRFLRVRSEDGRILAFRYYDPRVLRAYLPTCTPGEIAEFFGPLRAIVAEAEGDPRVAHVYRSGPAGLEAGLFELPAPAELPARAAPAASSGSRSQKAAERRAGP